MVESPEPEAEEEEEKEEERGSNRQIEGARWIKSLESLTALAALTVGA